MPNVTGFVLPALAIGLGSLYLKPQRGFYPQPNEIGTTPEIPQVTIEEVHNDILETTEHPVERGAAIGDHAYKRPAEVVIKCAWSNSPTANPSGIIGAAIGVGSVLVPGGAIAAAVRPTANAIGSLLSGNGTKQINDIYKKLLALQAAAVLFDIYTGKRIYKDMLFRSITETTEKNTENSLVLTIACKQILLTSTRTVSLTKINPDAQSMPQKTMPVQNAGNQQLVFINGGT